MVELITDKGTGSGFFVDKAGHGATASHVVLDAKEIYAVNSNGRKFRATLDKVGGTSDVAELTLEGFDTKNQPYLELADSSKLKPNDVVYAFGCPRGYRPAYVSPGRFKADVSVYELVNKDAIARKFATAWPEHKKDWLAALSRSLVEGKVHLEPGNSGGPLLDSSGKVVGVADFVDRTDRTKSYFIRAEELRELLQGKPPAKAELGKTPFNWRQVDFK